MFGLCCMLQWGLALLLSKCRESFQSVAWKVMSEAQSIGAAGRLTLVSVPMPGCLSSWHVASITMSSSLMWPLAKGLFVGRNFCGNSAENLQKFAGVRVIVSRKRAEILCKCCRNMCCCVWKFHGNSGNFRADLCNDPFPNKEISELLKQVTKPKGASRLIFKERKALHLSSEDRIYFAAWMLLAMR